MKMQASGSCALVQPSGNTYQRPRQAVKASQSPATKGGFGVAELLRPRITHVDRAIIRHYWERNSLRGESPQERWALHERLSSRAPVRHLPLDLENRLSELSPGYQRVEVGNSVLLVETRDYTVIDAMRNTYCAG